jgi:hypothetical protein
MAQAGDDAETIAAIGTANQGYQGALAGVDLKRDQALRTYGLAETTDAGPDTIVDAATGRRFRLDVAGNPYSVAAQIQHTFEKRKRGDLNSAASGGFLYDGAHGRRAAGTARAQGQAMFDFSTGVQGDLLALVGEGQDAYQRALELILGVRSGQTDRAAARAKPDPAPAPGQDGGGTPAPGTPAAAIFANPGLVGPGQRESPQQVVAERSYREAMAQAESEAKAQTQRAKARKKKKKKG